MKSFGLRFDGTKHSATRGPLPLNKPLWDLPQRDDEVGAFTGFAALVDAVIGHHD